MIRVIHSVSNMHRAGLETMLMNYYRRIDRTKIQFDFLVNKADPGDYDDEIRSLGGRIYISPGLSPHKYPEYMRYVKKILSEDPSIKILHAHNEAMEFYALRGAQRAGLPVRIAHSHSKHIALDYKWPLKFVCKNLVKYPANNYWSCGHEAGIYFYGKKLWEKEGLVIPNAIIMEDFLFNDSKRKQLRGEYHLENNFVVGHVGRFDTVKNHIRLIEIFKELLKMDPSARLVLIGVGDTQNNIRNAVKQSGLEDKVLILGLRNDVNDWYSAMDAFCMPSFSEGIPVVGVEAQTSGLPCLYSEGVPSEADILPTTKRLSLKESNEKWAETLFSFKGKRMPSDEAEKLVRSAGFDVNERAKILQQAYFDLLGI